jgi:sigma-54 dependent transcriptional regulator, acetoin dehydrogenase operon transcriptional activator AcoR
MRTIPQRREEPALLFHEEGIIHARGDMPIALQAKLLRFLDQWTVRAVGSASEETVDVQVVSATNSGLEQALEKRQFRADLLYRLRGVEVTLPPLRERSDFPEVVHALLAEHTADCSISDDAIRTMREHSWPGNFRELKNFLLRMILVANSSVLLPNDVSRVFNLTNVHSNPEPAPMAQSDLRKSRKDTIIATYRCCNGNVIRTARELGCHGILFTANSGEWGSIGPNLADLVATHQTRDEGWS